MTPIGSQPKYRGRHLCMPARPTCNRPPATTPSHDASRQIDEVHIDLTRVRGVFDWYGLICCSDQPTCVNDVWQRRHRLERILPNVTGATRSFRANPNASVPGVLGQRRAISPIQARDSERDDEATHSLQGWPFGLDDSPKGISPFLPRLFRPTRS